MVVIRIGYHARSERTEPGQRGLDVFEDGHIGKCGEQAVGVVFERNSSAEVLERPSKADEMRLPHGVKCIALK